MYPFELHNMSQVQFGPGVRKNMGKTLENMGVNKVAIITDAFIRERGLIAEIEASIKEAGIEALIFDGALPENPSNIIEECANYISKNTIDALVAIGGGSVMDLAKTARLLTANSGSIRDYYDITKTRKTSSLPLVLIPTTAGTSSEISHGAVLFDTEMNIKTGFLGSDLAATLACIDPELCLGLPAKLTASTGFDCLCHAAEAVTATINTNPVTVTLGIEAIRLVAHSLKRVVEHGEDISARTDMSLACLYSGAAFENCTPHLAHSFGHTVGAMYHIPHGEACGAFLAPVIECVGAIMPERVREIGKALGVAFEQNATSETICKETGVAIRKLYRSIGLRPVSELIPEEDISTLAQNVARDPGLYYAPIQMNASDFEQIIQEEYKF